LGSELEKCVGSRVHLVGVSISCEKNFYRLPFTPPLSGSPYRSFTISRGSPLAAATATTPPPPTSKIVGQRWGRRRRSNLVQPYQWSFRVQKHWFVRWWLLSVCVMDIIGVARRVIVAETMETVLRHRRHLYFFWAQRCESSSCVAYADQIFCWCPPSYVDVHTAGCVGSRGSGDTRSRKAVLSGSTSTYLPCSTKCSG
jgi:hypothetical protein